jgi:hypothetical protein
MPTLDEEPWRNADGTFRDRFTDDFGEWLWVKIAVNAKGPARFAQDTLSRFAKDGCPALDGAKLTLRTETIKGSKRRNPPHRRVYLFVPQYRRMVEARTNPQNYRPSSTDWMDRDEALLALGHVRGTKTLARYCDAGPNNPRTSSPSKGQPHPVLKRPIKATDRLVPHERGSVWCRFYRRDDIEKIAKVAPQAQWPTQRECRDEYAIGKNTLRRAIKRSEVRTKLIPSAVRGLPMVIGCNRADVEKLAEKHNANREARRVRVNDIRRIRERGSERYYPSAEAAQYLGTYTTKFYKIARQRGVRSVTLPGELNPKGALQLLWRESDLKTLKPQPRRGRPPKPVNDVTADKRMFTNWTAARASGCISYEDWHARGGPDPEVVRAAIDRYRKRRKNQPSQSLSRPRN